MKIIKNCLIFLSGKKSSLAAIVGLVIAYLAAKNIIGESEVVFYGGLNAIIFGVGSYATGKIVYAKK